MDFLSKHTQENIIFIQYLYDIYKLLYIIFIQYLMDKYVKNRKLILKFIMDFLSKHTRVPLYKNHYFTYI